MPEPAEQQYEDAGEEPQQENVLTKKIGPLATWQWAAVVVAAYLLYHFISNRGASGVSTTNAPVPVSDPFGTGAAPGSGGGSTSGTPGGDTTTNITNNYYGGKPSTPPLRTKPPVPSVPIPNPVGGSSPSPVAPHPAVTTPGSGTTSHTAGTSVHVNAPTTTPTNERTPVTAIRSGMKYEGGPTTTVHAGSIPSKGINAPATTRKVATSKTPVANIRSGMLYEGGNNTTKKPTVKKVTAPKKPVAKPVARSNSKPTRL